MRITIILLIIIVGAIVSMSLPANSQIATVSMLDSNLIWDSETKTTNIFSGENEARFIFNFTNVSTSNLRILSVHPSCGCTTAQLPPLPWIIPSGTNGQIGIKVSISGKSGTLYKTITIGTDKTPSTLTVKIVVVALPVTAISGTNRLQNQMLSQSDRQAVFKGNCARCHVNAVEGKYGQQLYDSVCGVCHEAEHRATMVPDLHVVTVPTGELFWRTWIIYGRPGSLMPAFSKAENGPLTDMQIVSLAAYLSMAIPSHITNSFQ